MQGLVAATHTPFDAAGELLLSAVEAQAALLERTGVAAVFIGGTTGESHSLTVPERLALAERWASVCRGSALKLVVHVGTNCLADARTLAAQAEKLQATAISALSPSYFKPRSLDVLLDCCAAVAAAAPQTPFYFYDIPVLTGVSFSMPDFLDQAVDRLPTLVGIKFTNPDLMAFQRCLHAQQQRFDIPWGVDEYLLAALACGAQGAVGSSYNFAAPIYRRLIAAFERGDLAAARVEQFRSVQLIELLGRFGYMAAAKAVMDWLGVDVGGPRLPQTGLSAAARGELRKALDQLGFWNWLS